MKILVLQLARLGDIYQTWPVIRALRRTHGSLAQIDLLTRERFFEATVGLSEVDQVYRLDSKNILADVFTDMPNVQSSVDAIGEFASKLKQNSYDRIINLSFSNFSSYLTEAISCSGTEISGYSRYDDGFLRIPDEVSSYFFAQVGVGLSNRIHVTDLFAQVAGVELIASDYSNNFGLPLEPQKNQIVVHVGASATHKMLTSHKWQSLLAGLLKFYVGQIILIGSKEEQSFSNDIQKDLQSEKVTNLVGKTSLNEVMQLISESELVVGGDSAPVHMAALTETPVLNLSLETVNFWETGPKSARSQIIKLKNERELNETLFVSSVESILHDEPVPSENIQVVSAIQPYNVRVDYCFGWEMAQSIYMQKDLPYISDPLVKHSLRRLYEANQLAIEQLGFLRKDAKNKVAVETFEQCDLMFSTIEKLSPEVGVIVRWIRAEKLRVAPAEYSQVLNEFENIHLALSRLIETYPIENWYFLKNGVLNDKNILDEA